MDTAKAIGIIVNNPEFADVRSLEGVAPTKKHAVVHHCRAHNRRHGCRSDHQLCDHRYGKKA